VIWEFPVNAETQGFQASPIRTVRSLSLLLGNRCARGPAPSEDRNLTKRIQYRPGLLTNFPFILG